MDSNINLHRIDTQNWNVSVDRLFQEGIDNLMNHQNPLLIEGLLFNLPFPKVVFLRRNLSSNAKTIVNDSRNLVSALYNFINNEYALEGCRIMPHLTGKYFRDLEPSHKRRLIEKEMCCIVDVSYSSLEQQYLSMYFDLF